MRKTNKKTNRPKKSSAVNRGEEANMISIVARGRPATEAEPDLSDSDLSSIIKISDYMSERKIETSIVRDNLNRFLDQLKDIVSDSPDTFGKFHLSEIEISAEITLSGGIRLLGSGAEAEAKGGIKFTIKR